MLGFIKPRTVLDAAWYYAVQTLNWVFRLPAFIGGKFGGRSAVRQADKACRDAVADLPEL